MSAERPGNQAPTYSGHFFNNTSRPGQNEQRSNISFPSASSPPSYRPPPAVGRTMELPPLPQAPVRAGGGSFSPASASRSAGVSLMLNPTDPDETSRDRRRKMGQTSSTHSMPSLPPLATTTRPYGSATDAPSPMSSLGPRPPRRILTPRLPPRSPTSLHKAVSMNRLPSTASNLQQYPLAVSPRTRTYTIDPVGAGTPSLPTPSAASRQNYGFPPPAPSSHPTSRRASLGTSRSIRPQSESTSPRSSYSGYSQAEQTSPAPYGSSLMPTLSAPYTSDPGNENVPTSIASDRPNHMGVPMTSSGGPNVYQMMTLETTSGTVQLPVDVQAASRVADEKRRRNAGASARFRQRRKEKEKEASTAISRLEQQLKNLSDDADFYKRERDYFAGVVLQVPGGERHFPRPQSPRHRRTPSASGPGGGGASYRSAHEQDSHSPGEGRNVRRRTSAVSMNPPPHSQTPLAGPGPPSYGSQTYGHQSVQQHGPGPLPSPGAGGVPLPALHAAPQTGPWNPYFGQRHSSGHSSR